jgi:hypothetical protein
MDFKIAQFRDDINTLSEIDAQFLHRFITIIMILKTT